MHALLKLKPFVVIAVAFGYTFFFLYKSNNCKVLGVQNFRLSNCSSEQIALKLIFVSIIIALNAYVS